MYGRTLVGALAALVVLAVPAQASAGTVTLNAHIGGNVELVGFSKPATFNGVSQTITILSTRSGEPLALSGTVRDDAFRPIATRTQVTIVALEYPFKRERIVETVTSGAGGAYHATLPTVRRTTFFLARVSDPSLDVAQSAYLGVEVQPDVHIAGGHQVGKSGYELRGRLLVAGRPQDAGSLLLQPLLPNGEIHGATVLRVAADGSFTVRLGFAGKPPGTHTYPYQLVFRPRSSKELVGWTAPFTATVTIPAPQPKPPPVHVVPVVIPPPPPPAPVATPIPVCSSLGC
jgi:hypothetical protein